MMETSKTQQIVKKRDKSIDAMKFLLISMVIFDHCQVATRLYITPGYEHIYQFFQAINMPIFVFISGYFMRRNTSRKKFYKGIVMLLETYLVFQIPYLIISIPYYHNQVNPLVLLRPGWAMWYLPALVIWRIAAYELPERIISRKGPFLVFLFLLSLLGGFMTYDGRVFQRVITYAPMFFIGFYCGKTTVLEKLRKINPIFPILVFLSYATFLIVANPHTSALFFQNIPYFNEFLPVMESFVVRIAWHIVTLVVGASAASLMLRIKNEMLAQLGMHTLLFYVGHIGLLAFTRPYMSAHGLLQKHPIHAVAVFCMIIVFFTILSQFKWHKYILNPVTSLFDKLFSSVKQVHKAES